VVPIRVISRDIRAQSSNFQKPLPATVFQKSKGRPKKYKRRVSHSPIAVNYETRNVTESGPAESPVFMSHKNVFSQSSPQNPRKRTQARVSPSAGTETTTSEMQWGDGGQDKDLPVIVTRRLLEGWVCLLLEGTPPAGSQARSRLQAVTEDAYCFAAGQISNMAGLFRLQEKLKTSMLTRCLTWLAHIRFFMTFAHYLATRLDWTRL
jgi:hypothetical protein